MNAHTMVVNDRRADLTVYGCKWCPRKVRVKRGQATVVVRGDITVKHKNDPLDPDAAAAKPTDKTLELEFAYTKWEDSCQAKGPGKYLCRRPNGHTGLHAAGFGTGRRLWTDKDTEPLTEDEMIEFGRQLESASDAEIMAAVGSV